MRYVRTLARAVLSAALVLPAALGGAAFAADSVQQPVRVIPDDLYRYAVEHGCEQVPDFYVSRPDIKAPPYVYGLLTNPYADRSAAFWCERPEGGSKKYVLLLRLNERSWPGGCEGRIDNQDTASGLSVIRRLDEPLEWYSDAITNAALANLEPGQKTDGAGIQSAYGNAGRIYYCHAGRWVSRALK